MILEAVDTVLEMNARLSFVDMQFVERRQTPCGRALAGSSLPAERRTSVSFLVRQLGPKAVVLT